MRVPETGGRSAQSHSMFKILLGTTMIVGTAAAPQAMAQTRVVSACTGVQLPRSVVTDIVAPVVTGITGPIETSVNGILGSPLLGLLLPPLNTNATGLLNQAASGAPIALQVLDTNGNIVGPNDQCQMTSDAIGLDTAAGISIGGNRIVGLGVEGTPSFAADINAIALGNNARAETGASGSIAFGTDAQVTAANSVALGAGSIATRGARNGYVAIGVAGVQNSAGEVSVGTAASQRQITNVAAGSAPTDAANVGQLSGVADQVAALASGTIVYDDNTRTRATLGGAVGTVLANVGAGTVAAGSTEAVNGSQLFATNQRIEDTVAALGMLDTRVSANTSQLATLSAGAVQYDNVARDRLTLGGATGTTLSNVAVGSVAATSTDAVNGSQLFATNAQVAANTAVLAQVGNGATGPVRYSTAVAPTTPNGGIVSSNLTLVGVDGGAVALHNVASGMLGVGSTDAVNGDQLNATNQTVAALSGRTTMVEETVATNTTQIAGNTAAIADLRTTVAGTDTAVGTLTTRVDANSTAITDLQTQLGNQPLQYADAAAPTVPNGGTLTDDATLVGVSGTAVGLRNVRAGAVAIGSTDAVNGGQLAETNVQVAANSAAITTLNNTLTGSTVTPIQYSNGGTPTVPNGGTLTNDVTLIGADPAAAVALHNVASGSVASGSTDAVNGDQLFAVATQSSNSLQYDRDATGTRTNRVTLTGGNAALPVTIANVAAGTVAAGSTQAVNGGQLATVNQTAPARLEVIPRTMMTQRGTLLPDIRTQRMPMNAWQAVAVRPAKSGATQSASV